MSAMKIGDAVHTSYIRHEGAFGWAGFKAPKGERFVFLLLGTHPKDSTEPFDPEKVLNGWGWRFCDSGSGPKGEAGTAECEAPQSGGSEASASPNPSSPSSAIASKAEGR